MEKDIKNKIDKINNKKNYSIREVVDTNLIKDSNDKPSEFVVYRLINRGVLSAVNLSYSQVPRYYIKGADLKKFLTEHYKKI